MHNLIYQRRFGVPLGIMLSIIGIVLLFEFRTNIVLVIICILLVMSGLYLLNAGVNRHKWLKKTGIKVSTKASFITKEVIRINKLGWSNDQIVFKIVSIGNNPVNQNPQYNFVSDALYFQSPNIKIGDVVDVYIDPHNPQNYWVDISQLTTTSLALKSVTEEPGYYKSLDGLSYQKIEK